VANPDDTPAVRVVFIAGEVQLYLACSILHILQNFSEQPVTGSAVAGATVVVFQLLLSRTIHISRFLEIVHNNPISDASVSASVPPVVLSDRGL